MPVLLFNYSAITILQEAYACLYCYPTSKLLVYQYNLYFTSHYGFVLYFWIRLWTHNLREREKKRQNLKERKKQRRKLKERKKQKMKMKERKKLKEREKNRHTSLHSINSCHLAIPPSGKSSSVTWSKWHALLQWIAIRVHCPF